VNSEILMKRYKNYKKFCISIGHQFLDYYDKFPVLKSFKIFPDTDPDVLLKMISDESPLYVLTDERIFNFLNKSEKVELIPMDTIGCKGFWFIHEGARFFFCNRTFEPNRTKILLYRKSRVENSAIDLKF